MGAVAMMGRGNKKMKKFKIDDGERKAKTEVRSAMQGIFKTVIDSCGIKRAAGLLVPALIIAMLVMVLAPSSAFAANQIGTVVDSSPSVIDTGKDVLMITVPTSKQGQASDLTKAVLSIEGIGGLNASMVEAVILNATSNLGGPESAATTDGSVNPNTLSNFGVFLNGNTGGGETWYIYIRLTDAAKDINSIRLTLTSMTGSDNANLPFQTAPKDAQIGCDAVAPSDVSLVGKTDTSITFSWLNNTTNAWYNVYRDSGGGYEIYNVGHDGTQDYVDNGLGAANYITPLTKYAYIVRGYSTGRSCESGDSNILITQTKSDNQFQIYTCGGCHTTPPDDAPTLRGMPDGGTIGRHANPYHTGGVKTGTEVCIWCHVDPGSDPAHRDKKIQMNTTAIFGYSGSFYDKNRDYLSKSYPEAGVDNDFAQTNLPIHVDNATTQNGWCVNTWCHGSRGASPIWGYSSGYTQCTICHGMGDNQMGRDTEGDTANTDEEVGAHNSHMHLGTYVKPNDPSDFLNISTANTCSECHLEPTAHEDSGHYDSKSPAEVIFGTMATAGDSLTPFYNTSSRKCTNTYCHDGRNFKNKWADATMVNDPVWNDDTYLDDGGDASNCTNKCHGYPPGGDHDPDPDCYACHEHMESDNFSYKPEYYYKHIDGTVQGLDCSGCHGYPPTTASLTNTATLGWTQRSVNYTNAAGNHLEHSGKGVSCAGCHTGGKPGGGQHNDGSKPTSINMGFLTVDGYAGNYTAPAIENATSYILNTGGSTSVTIDPTPANPRTCDNIYCHSDGGDYAGSYSFKQFDWDSTSGTTCASCHPLTPINDGHQEHALTHNYPCYECHSNTVDSTNNIIGNHVNVAKNVAFGNIGSGGSYNSPATGQCDSIYCHSDGKDPSPGYAYAPVWDQSTTCMSCHGGPNSSTGGAGSSLDGSHTAHTDATGYLCTDCHYKVVSPTNTITAPLLHGDDVKNVAVMAANGGDDTDYNGSTCSTTWCHGTTSPTWGSAGSACATCHGTDSGTGAVPPDTGGSSDATDAQVGAHELHLRTSAYANSYFIVCEDCHNVPGSVGETNHIDSEQPAEVPLDGGRARDGTNIPAATTTYIHRRPVL
jgi:predicted CxxxxCH...CXXCH cytochrome family protein